MGMREPQELIEELRSARSRTRRVADDLAGERELGPKLAIVNPPRWEVGHVGWFQEWWCLRGGSESAASILPNADRLYNSATVPHATRWDLPLPSFEDTIAYRERVLDLVETKLLQGPKGEEAYFARLAVRHEDMHAEAFHYTRQTLGYPQPDLALKPFARREPGDIEHPGGAFRLGALPEEGFVFDNEKWSHPVVLAPFRIARSAVTYGELREFVDAGGYRKREYWSEAGWAWKDREQPLYWKDGKVRRFERWIELPADEPVRHVNWHEANAFCRFAGRRLPSEAEWEAAASAGRERRFPWADSPPSAEQANLDGTALGCVDVVANAAGDSPHGCRQMIGNVWEWTADDFRPYPGFAAGPYRDYSAPWFGTHKALRGGCWVTRGRLLRNTWRNFYLPDRRDVWAGFRTCALQP